MVMRRIETIFFEFLVELLEEAVLDVLAPRDGAWYLLPDLVYRSPQKENVVRWRKALGNL